MTVVSDLQKLDNINEKETQKQVKKYFEKKFPQLVVKAGYRMSQLKSPVINDIPSSTSFENSIDKQASIYIEARETVLETVYAINRCPEKYRNLLLLKYVDELPDFVVMQRIGYEKSQYSKYKNNAFLWFANSFELIEDLHIYKTEY